MIAPIIQFDFSGIVNILIFVQFIFNLRRLN
jgi:hypothetical protein